MHLAGSAWQPALLRQRATQPGLDLGVCTAQLVSGPLGQGIVNGWIQPEQSALALDYRVTVPAVTGSSAEYCCRSAVVGAASSTVKRFRRSARPAGFEPATRCLEGSCSVRLSYGRPNVIVHGEDHTTATRRSQCVAPARPLPRPGISRRPEATPQLPERTRTRRQP